MKPEITIEEPVFLNFFKNDIEQFIKLHKNKSGIFKTQIGSHMASYDVDTLHIDHFMPLEAGLIIKNKYIPYPMLKEIWFVEQPIRQCAKCGRDYIIANISWVEICPDCPDDRFD